MKPGAYNQVMGGSFCTSETANSSCASNDDFWNLELDDLIGSSTGSNHDNVAVEAPNQGPAGIRLARSPVRRVKPTPRSFRGPSNTPLQSARSLPNLKTSSTGSSSAGSTVTRSVSFHKVQVREFQQILAEHPSSDKGPSLGLGWHYNEKKDTDVDKVKRSQRKGSARSVSPKRRTDKARQWGYSKEDIEKNCKKNRKVQKQRQETVSQLLLKEVALDPKTQKLLKSAQHQLQAV